MKKIMKIAICALLCAALVMPIASLVLPEVSTTAFAASAPKITGMSASKGKATVKFSTNGAKGTIYFSVYNGSTRIGGMSKACSGSGSATFTFTITGSTKGKTFKVKAYVKTSAGTSSTWSRSIYY